MSKGRLNKTENFFDDQADEEESEDEDFDPDKSEEDDQEDFNNNDENVELTEEDDREKDYKKRLVEENDGHQNFDDKKNKNKRQENINKRNNLLNQSNRIEDDEEQLQYQEESEDGDSMILNNMNKFQEQEEMLENKLVEIYQQTLSEKINEELFFDLKDFDVYELKLSNLAHYQQKAFSKDAYEFEPQIKFNDEKGRKVIKNIPFENYLRWKYLNNKKANNKKNSIVDDENINELNEENQNKDVYNSSEYIDTFFNLKNKNKLDNANNNIKDSNPEIIGNTFLIELEDGTFKIKIGNNIYDMAMADSSNMSFGVEDINSKLNVLLGNIDKKMIIKKSYKDMFSDRRKSSISEDYFYDIENLASKDGAIDNEASRTKTAHSYFDMNKFSTEEYKAKQVNTLQKIEKLLKANTQVSKIAKNTFTPKFNDAFDGQLLNKKRRNNNNNDDY
jgi:hypothetical protein